MQIKTLAEILAETSKSTKTSRKKKKPANNPHSSSKKPRTPSSAARGFATSKKNKKTFHPASPYQPSDHCETQYAQPAKEIDPNSIKNLLIQGNDKRKALEHADNDNQFDNLDSESLALENIALENLALENHDTENFNTNTVDSDGTDLDSLLAHNIVDNPLNNKSIDNLPVALKAYLKTPEQRQAEKEEIKANSRLRWLAFYYLSRREHSKVELRQKLIDKEQDPDKIDALLTEFENKGYQSDYRTALMLIREGIRKRRGRVRIKNDFYKRKVSMPANIDELIDMAMADNEAFVDVMSDNDLIDGVDWLQLAVEARVKKYGDAIPTEPKSKARQLRFLQYRGFKPDVCFEAISHNLETLENRF